MMQPSLQKLHQHQMLVHPIEKDMEFLSYFCYNQDIKNYKHSSIRMLNIYIHPTKERRQPVLNGLYDNAIVSLVANVYMPLQQ